MHVPGWHEATKEWQEAGDIQMVGIIQEQHPDRARLFMEWKQMGWPIMVDSLNLLETTVVPQTLAIDEHGIIRQIQPPRDDLDALRADFVDVRFDAPARQAEQITPSDAESAYLSASDAQLDAVVEAFRRELARDPGNGYKSFRTGVAYRKRYDSALRKPGDFENAVRYWEQALSIDPNNYIWRRRIQQYGPRLDKPYPFYDWVPTARAEITARGETPPPLVVEPGGAEFASPVRAFTAESQPVEPPELDDRIYRDPGRYVTAETTMVPGTIEPGASARAHVTFVPNDAIKAHWNNEVDDLIFWIDVPDGWQVDRRAQTIPNPPEVVSLEPRKVELELKAPAEVRAGRVEIPGYALYYVCEDVNGLCVYRRQDVTLRVEVR